MYCRYPSREYQLTADVGLVDGEIDGTFEGDWLGP